MFRVLTSEQMRRCDAATIGSGTPSATLMDRAAAAVARIAAERFDPRKTLVVCGGGNNGGDGVLCALKLAVAGFSVDIFMLGDKTHTSEETGAALKAAENYIAESEKAAEYADGTAAESEYADGRAAYFSTGDEKGGESMPTKGGEPIPTKGRLSFTEFPDFSSYTLIVDAVFGIGLSRPVSGDFADVFRKINSCGVRVLSVDVPSGLSADTGKKTGAAINADATVAIQAYKVCHTVSDGVDLCGKVYAADIGISTDLFKTAPLVLSDADLELIPKRKRSANKGTFGRVLAVAGSRGMSGAAYLCALAAYRTGAGIVEIFTPEENRTVLQTLLPEAIVTAYDADDPIGTEDSLKKALQRATAVVIGPGLGQSRMSELLTEKTLASADAPVIVDADALNITAQKGIAFPTDIPVIVTPHPGEMSRLCGRQTKEICADPQNFAKSYASENDVICVLKYARTVITDGEDVFVNLSGGPSLAKGGSGDVLTGVIAGMLCSDLSPIDAAALGVYVHGAAGDITAERSGDYSPLASETANAVSEVLKKRR